MEQVNGLNIAILQKGFRPFFLVSSLFAALGIPLWAWRWSTHEEMDWVPVYWHAHEMIWGFALAVIAGFLLTAVENWTKEKTVNPWQLGFLVVLWFMGRLALFDGSPSVLGSVVDCLFLPALTFFVGRAIFRARNKRNYKVFFILAVLAILNVVVHLSAHKVLGPDWSRRGVLAGIDVVLILIILVGGRVIPFFTRRGASVTAENIDWVERALVVAAPLMLIIELGAGEGVALGVILVILAVLMTIRMWGWQTKATFKIPLLWVLHLAHVWLILGFLARGVSFLSPGMLTPSVGLHILTLGGIGTVCLGMMARVSMGHTGRPLKAPVLAIIAFVVLTVSLILRTFVVLVFPSELEFLVIGASTLWATAFLLFAVQFFGILMSPRPDGKPG